MKEIKEIRKEAPRSSLVRTAAVFSLGAAVGSVIALLYAPASGKVTRKRLAMKAKNLRRVMTRRLGQTTRELADRAEHVREAASEWITDHLPHQNGRHTRHVSAHRG